MGVCLSVYSVSISVETSSYLPNTPHSEHQRILESHTHCGTFSILTLVKISHGYPEASNFHKYVMWKASGIISSFSLFGMIFFFFFPFALFVK